MKIWTIFYKTIFYFTWTTYWQTLLQRVTPRLLTLSYPKRPETTCAKYSLTLPAFQWASSYNIPRFCTGVEIVFLQIDTLKISRPISTQYRYFRIEILFFLFFVLACRRLISWKQLSRVIQFPSTDINRTEFLRHVHVIGRAGFSRFIG